ALGRDDDDAGEPEPGLRHPGEPGGGGPGLRRPDHAAVLPVPAARELRGTRSESPPARLTGSGGAGPGPDPPRRAQPAGVPRTHREIVMKYVRTTTHRRAVGLARPRRGVRPRSAAASRHGAGRPLGR